MLRKEDFEPNMKTEDKIPGAQTEIRHRVSASGILS